MLDTHDQKIKKVAQESMVPFNNIRRTIEHLQYDYHEIARVTGKPVVYPKHIENQIIRWHNIKEKFLLRKIQYLAIQGLHISKDELIGAIITETLNSWAQTQGVFP